MTVQTADVVICGAGIAGIAAAYHLVVRQGVKNVLLVDERAPLTLTSDKSTECYRNWWPGPGDGMVRFMNRTIDLLEELAHESGNVFNMNRRGYLYATADPAQIAIFRQAGLEAESLGAGLMRVHDGSKGATYVPAEPHGFASPLTGSDLLLDQALIRQHFPYLSEETVAVIHARRCGYFSAQQLGMYMLEQARARGLRFVNERMIAVDVRDGAVQAVKLASGETVATRKLVLAAGPLMKPAAAMLGVDLPIFSERHVKLYFNDELGVLPRDTPLLIWTDPVTLAWSDEERTLLAEDEEGRRLLQPFAAGVHGRSEGAGQSRGYLILWTYDMDPVEPTWPITWEPAYPEIVLRGFAAMLPALQKYFGKAPPPLVDGGYYTKTKENRPLIGPLPVQGAYVIGAFSGYGLMAASAGGELLAAHVTGGALPDYARWFLLERYADPAYQKLLANWGASGQL